MNMHRIINFLKKEISLKAKPLVNKNIQAFIAVTIILPPRLNSITNIKMLETQLYSKRKNRKKNIIRIIFKSTEKMFKKPGAASTPKQLQIR